jgi:hypothetical protein
MTDASAAPIEHPVTASRPCIFIATPAYGCLVNNAYLSSLIMLRSALSRSGVASMVQLTGNESLVQRARNLMTAQFLKTDCTHMLWLDADLAFGPDTVLSMLEFDRDVTAAIYCKKNVTWDKAYADPPASATEPVEQRGLDYNINLVDSAKLENGRYCEVLDAATGFMLIKRSVVEKMYAAYGCLQCINDVPGSEIKDYVALYDCMIDPETRRYLSEDYAFCRRWQLLGGSIHACLATPLSHIGSYTYRNTDCLDLPLRVGRRTA